MNIFLSHDGLPLTLAGLIVAFSAGALAHAWLARKRARERRQPPKKWPLAVRAIINSEERKTWRWLELVFVDYAVMVKLPITRFSAPNSAEEGLHWYELLSSLYCTFTIVRADGRVVGCVDLPSRSGRTSKAQRIKTSLLAHCGVPYLVLHPGTGPTAAQLRLRFLGESASAMPQGTYQAAAVKVASSNLRSSVTRGRQSREAESRPAPLMPLTPDSAMGDDSNYAGAASSGFHAQWQDDSFIMPLDSRKAGL